MSREEEPGELTADAKVGPADLCVRQFKQNFLSAAWLYFTRSAMQSSSDNVHMGLRNAELRYMQTLHGLRA